LVGLDELALDLSGQRAFWFDFDVAEAGAQEQLAVAARERAEVLEREWEASQERLRGDVFAFWRRNGGWEECDDDQDEQWGSLRRRLSAHGLEAPRFHKESHFRTAVSALLSAKEGVPVGFAYKKLVEVAHCLAENHTHLLRHFGWALSAYGTQTLLDAQDQSGRWKEKRRRIRSAMQMHDPAYEPDDAWSDVLQFLFPAIAGKLSRLRPELPA
jgi:hypothetical protein